MVSKKQNMRLRVMVLASSVSLIFSLLLVFCSTPTTAVSVDSQQKGLTVSPLRTELTAAPGTSQNGTLSLTNSTAYPITVRLTTEEFSVINQQYDYAFNIETQLIKWVTFTPEIMQLAVGETKQATFTVGVPLAAEPGGRYLSMFATTDAGTSSDGVVSRQRIASLLYLSVTGDVSRSGHLVSLNAPWLITSPTDWTAALQNTGTTHYRSRYNVALQPLIGSGTVATTSGDALILPGTVRLVKGKMPSPGLQGIYKITYTIGLGDTPAVVETRILIYLPPVAIIVSLFAVILILSLISEYRTRKKRTNQSAEQPYRQRK